MRNLILTLMLMVTAVSFGQDPVASVGRGDAQLRMYSSQHLVIGTDTSYKMANLTDYNIFLSAIRGGAALITTSRDQSSNLSIYQSSNRTPDDRALFLASIARSGRIDKVVATPANGGSGPRLMFIRWSYPRETSASVNISGNPDGWAGQVRLPAGRWNIKTYLLGEEIGSVQGVEIGPRVNPNGTYKVVHHTYSLREEDGQDSSFSMLDFSDCFLDAHLWDFSAYIQPPGVQRVPIDNKSLHGRSRYVNGDLRVIFNGNTHVYTFPRAGLIRNRGMDYYGDAIDTYANPNSQPDADGRYDISLTGWRNLERIEAVPIPNKWGSTSVQESVEWDVRSISFNGQGGDKAIYRKLKPGRYQFRGYLGGRLVLQTEDNVYVGPQIRTRTNNINNYIAIEVEGQYRNTRFINIEYYNESGTRLGRSNAFTENRTGTRGVTVDDQTQALYIEYDLYENSNPIQLRIRNIRQRIANPNGY